MRRSQANTLAKTTTGEAGCRDTKLNNNLDDSEDRDNRGGDEDASGNGSALPISFA